VVELVDIAGLKPKEAATALRLAPGTVRMRLMRARARLRTTTTNQIRGERND
jgi:DNA-directed RNA polymerase specialized sigma24 family protein